MVSVFEFTRLDKVTRLASESATLDLSLPAKFMFENYQIVIERGKLLSSFMNSFMYATFSSMLIVFLASLAAFVLSRNQSKFNRFIYVFLVLGIAMPLNYVSLMKVMQYTHLINNRFGIILLFAALGIPISVFIASFAKGRWHVVTEGFFPRKGAVDWIPIF
jgi:raffinose/stachyose/melibiose transport system permease protein